MKKKELLRLFDQKSVEAGEPICWSHLDADVSYVGMLSNGHVAVKTSIYPVLESPSPSDLRMKPLFWHEDKPVYKGDRLWHDMVGDYVVVKGLQDDKEAAERGWFTTENSFYDACFCNWEKPALIPLAHLDGKPIFPGTKVWHTLSDRIITIQSKSTNGDLVDSNGLGRSLCYLSWKKKCVGYANVYNCGYGERSLGSVKSTIALAEASASFSTLGVARVEWEEDL